MKDWRVCRICSSEKFEARFEKNGFRIEKCLYCGLVQVTNPPQPSEIDSYYDDNFFDKHYQKLQTDPKTQGYEYGKFNYRLEEIEKRTRGKGRILDVGCSFGFFMDAAKKRGWKTDGVEISEFAANYARDKLGINVVNKPLNEANFDAGFFDVVTLWNVIEHLPDPIELMREIYRILKPAGMIVLTTGNAESLLARITRERWRVLIPPIHLSYFAPATIKYLLNSCDLELIEKTYPLPYESLLNKFRLLELVKKLKVSDKMLIYAKKMW
jgi:2-polyprenyl-3-methyl-5-hydroxy-6-metoxy-1,4-benzoquinol methylase